MDNSQIVCDTQLYHRTVHWKIGLGKFKIRQNFNIRTNQYQ